MFERRGAAQSRGARITHDDGVIEAQGLTSAGQLAKVNPGVGESNDGQTVRRRQCPSVNGAMPDHECAAKVGSVDRADDV
ncbi:hypothetical protein GCM10009826_34790 [Humibacillus xanthopallidus]